MTGRGREIGRHVRTTLRLAWRETRGSGRRLAHLAACIALGVAALVAVASVGASVERSVTRSARALLGGDVEIRATQPLSAGAEAQLAGLGPGVAVARVTELAAMARAGVGVSLVELKAVDGAWPLFGTLATDPAGPRPVLLGGGRALVHPSLLAQLGLEVGDAVAIGAATFTVAGRLVGEPDRAASVFTLGPRVLIAAEDLAATDLVRPGSRVRYRTLLGLPPGHDAEGLRADLAAALPDPALRITTFREAQPGLRRFWDQLTLYLGLAGLVALLVGGLGVAVGIRALVRERLDTIAVLRCLGASGRQVLAVYLAQAGGLGLAGSLAGALVGAAVQPALAPLLRQALPVEPILVPEPLAVLRGLAVGLGVTLLCALGPLLEVRRVAPALVLRREVEPLPPAPRSWPPVLAVAAGLAALALWQAGSWKLGGLFVGALAAGLSLLLLASRGVVTLARRLPRGRGGAAWRAGVAGLARPGGHATTVLVTLGLAVMLVVAVALVERSLRAELGAPPPRAPAFFFVDIQPDQAAPFARLVTDRTGEAPRLIPVVRARLAAIDGRPVPRNPGRRDEQWYLTREYALTWAEEPPGDNVVVAGRWWTAEEAARAPLASVEEEVARQLGVGLGDTVAFDVLGIPVRARVSSLRRVDWRSFEANFFVILSPGALAGAPATYLATAHAPPALEEPLQRAAARAFPNVTAVPVREVLERVGTLVAQLGRAVRLVMTVVVLAAAVVLGGALAVTRRERLYQSVILRVLGASRGAVARAFAVEYGLLGLAAGVVGTALALAVTWGVERWGLALPFRLAPGVLLAGVGLAVVVALGVGALGTWRLLGQKPLPVLRGE